MSIVRIGLAESKGYAEGYEAIFGKGKKKTTTPKEAAPAEAKPTAARSKKAPKVRVDPQPTMKVQTKPAAGKKVAAKRKK